MAKQLSEDNKDRLIASWVARDPSVAFDLYDLVIKGYPPDPPQNDPDQLPWCTCRYCTEMPTEVERVCCSLRPDHCMSRQAVSI